MKFRPRGRASLGVLMAVVVGLAAGGIAWADIPDSSAINVCYKINGGALRVIDTDKGGKCLPSETALNWNQTGPTGPRGPSGARGATGPKGTTGPAGTASEIYTTDGQRSVPANEGDDTIAYLTLPTGQYGLNAAIDAFSTDPANTPIGACHFSSSGPASFSPAAITDYNSLKLDLPDFSVARAGAVAITQTTDVGVDCHDVGNDMTFHVTLTATSIGAIHDQVH